ncbi:PREDICTED: acetylcholine receptor subunit alpha-like [Trachymyrmex cornetzi]|uniref:acetylcholine receptor subunit alpha-like n=1 Tax=Trachymyrmex cornetzi TaxID=471704 RepID=UPI00084F3288|nr:PREDICTED: acetylcholine receptor subunit alpha-like [Trachymyrmex cornetzi]
MRFFGQKFYPSGKELETISFLCRITISRFNHPAVSPDLNPVEHVWDLMGSRLRDYPRQPTTLAELEKILQEIWQKIPQNEITRFQCDKFSVWVTILRYASLIFPGCSGNPDAKRLYDDLLSNYNKLVRPTFNATDNLTVKIKLKLSQIIDVNLKNQVMTTNLWVEQTWYDYKLKWDPKEYGGVEMLHVPSDHIWRPDIVLYNNADGNFEVTLATKATLNYTGRVEWKPPAIYKSSCEIDVEYFPFDEQTCMMKFGSWTYDGFQVDLRHIDEGKNGSVKNSNGVVDIGIDLTEFYTSVEWDILEIPAVRHERYYTCCDEPYLDITFYITMRRKTLFYTVNLIIPCMGISFLTILVFYLPCDSGEKVMKRKDKKVAD